MIDTVYLNNAATSWPKAPGTDEAVASRIREIPHHADRAGFDAHDVPSDCRGLLAEYFRIEDPSKVILCSNATHALNIALHGFPWGKNPAVVTTAAEHNSVLRPLHYLYKHINLKVEIVAVDTDGRVIPENFEDAVKRVSPQLAVFSHASNVTGCVNDAEMLAGVAKKHGARVLLDASQTMGIENVKPELWGIDLVAFTGHKYLLGPGGTGGLYYSNEFPLEPVWVGGTGIHSEMDEMPPELPTRFEAGTPNDPSFAGLAHALQWQKKNPVPADDLNRRINLLSSGIASAGASVAEVDGRRTPVVSFNIPGMDTEEAGEMLFRGFNIICRTGLHCSPLIHKYLVTGEHGNIRFSLSRFTTDSEIDYAISAVKGLME